MSVNDSVSANVKKIRTKKKLSQESLAELAGCSKNHISAIERGKKFPGAVLLDKISEILDVKPYELFLDESDLDTIRKKDTVIEYVMDSIDKDRLKSLLNNKKK